MSVMYDEVPAYPFTAADQLQVDPRLAEVRAQRPVLRVRLAYGGDAWLVTRYADVKTVLADPRFSRAATVGKDVARTTAMGPAPTSILSLDPPEHSRLRRLVAKAFTGRRIELLRPSAQRIVDDLLTTMIDTGPPADIAEALCWPLPITIICELLGVPVDDRGQFQTWTDRLLVLSGDPGESSTAREELGAYIAALIARRRTDPSDDLLGALVDARDNEDRLSEEELVSIGITILFAGHETTANQAGNFIYTLLANRAYWNELVADPNLVPAAIEELSRITPLAASAGFTRLVTEDLELSGQHLRAGDAVVVEATAANRDAAVFADPEDIDFHRADNPHIAFGHGAHHCLGAQLARMELQTVIATLVRRLPTLRLATAPDAVHWRADHLVRGVTALPVAW
ncbi:MAG TPA: cytochrome P450 [Pseudonocardiaceae bacterium]|nr:cytochrome P450 [Pseudonocardiaceae bacterium]